MQTLNKNFNYKTSKNFFPATYDHRVWKTGLPVRSDVLKPHAGRLVVGWVTTSESRLLYVFGHLFLVTFFFGVFPRTTVQNCGNGCTGVATSRDAAERCIRIRRASQRLGVFPIHL